MPATTNYSWPTPADTDYVKDGAAAMRALGNAIDTTTKTNATTAAAASAAAQATADAAIPKSTVTTNGDLIRGTGAGAVTRIAPGSNGQILTIVSGVPTWATASAGSDSWTLISSVTPTGGSASVSFTSLTGWRKLWIVYSGLSTGATTARLGVRLNSVSTSTYFVSWQEMSGTSGINAAQAKTSFEMNPSSGSQTGYFGSAVIDNVNQTTPRTMEGFGGNGGINDVYTQIQGFSTTTAAITSLQLITAAGTFTATGTVSLYGVAV